jgi:hypothetical protein
MTAPDAVRDAHHRALRWAYVLTVQIDRLYAARAAAVESQRASFDKGRHDREDNHPFFIMAADAHFTLVAARQLLRSLMAFDGDGRLPAGLDDSQVRSLRDALEHWDEPNGRAARQMREGGLDPGAHQWSGDGSGVLGQLVSDADLRAWASAVYEELIEWQPW